MAKNLGWVKLHRTLAYNKLWLSEPFTKGQAWVDLLMLAGRDGIVHASYAWLAKRWQWNHKEKVRRFLAYLEEEGMIQFLASKDVTENVTGNVTANVTAFSLINWEKFQHRVTANVTKSVTAFETDSENLLIRSNTRSINTRNIKQEPYSPTRKRNRVVNGYEQHADIGDISGMEVDLLKEEYDEKDLL